MIRILLDVDGVIADYDHWYRRIIRRAIGHVSLVDDAAYDMARRYGLSRHQAHRVSAVAGTTPASDIEPYEMAVETTRHMMRSPNIDLYFLTSPLVSHVHWESDRRAWLDRLFGAGASDLVISTKQKHTVSGDLFIDDLYSNVRKWLKHNPAGRGVVWRQPWSGVRDLDDAHIGYRLSLHAGGWAEWHGIYSSAP